MSFIGAGAAIGIGASAAAAIGTGLAVGGVAMGVGSIASGILAKQAADAKQRAYRTMTEWAGGQYQDLGKYQQEQQDKILKSFLENRTTNLAQYKGGYETLISDFDTRFKELETAYSQASAGITSQFREGMGRVRETAAVGRTNTLAAIDQATTQSLARMQQAQAFTGLGGTTFGQSALAAEQRQGALQKGVVEEQYASQLAGIEQALTQGVSSLEQQRLANLTQMQQARVGGGLSMRQQLLGQTFAQREDVARQRAALGADFLNAQINLERERVARVMGGKEAQAQYAGSGYQAAAAIVGGATSGIASGIMGMYQPYLSGMGMAAGMRA
jgi:hypothetical protein